MSDAAIAGTDQQNRAPSLSTFSFAACFAVWTIEKQQQSKGRHWSMRI